MTVRDALEPSVTITHGYAMVFADDLAPKIEVALRVTANEMARRCLGKDFSLWKDVEDSVTAGIEKMSEGT